MNEINLLIYHEPLNQSQIERELTARLKEGWNIIGMTAMGTKLLFLLELYDDPDVLSHLAPTYFNISEN